jgi:hypothetical protein
MDLREKKYPSFFSFIVLLYCIPVSVYADTNSDHMAYQAEIVKTREDVSTKEADYVYKKLMQRDLQQQLSNRDDNTQFGLHGMEIPAVNVKGDVKKIDQAYSLLAHAGVDSLRSFETAWHRVSDTSGNPTNFEQLDFQLKEAKKYNMSHLFVFGYPPAKYTVANNKLSAVQPKYYDKYKEYLNATLSRVKGYDVKYAELANEVDAPNVWWMKSSPEQYVQEMKMLKESIDGLGLKIKTVAFAATYSRNSLLGGISGGRRFVDKSFELGIDKYSDAYSIHHFSYGNDDLPGYMRSEQAKYHLPNKLILDTEQLDTASTGRFQSNPYDLIKLFARGFYYYDMKRVDYFIAKDRYLNNKLYYTGLFDIDWNPKLRLLAYAMAVDSMKGHTLIGIYQPLPGIEAYVLKSKIGSPTKYSIVVWSNNTNAHLNNSVVLNGMSGNATIEHWNLDIEKNVNLNKGVPVDDRPIAIYTDQLPSWVNDNKFKAATIQADERRALKSHAPMPTDK